MAEPDRKGGGGISLRTLAIASAASLAAAMVTSQLFPPGTIYTAALTPVIVAAVSELLNRPVDRVAEMRRRRTLVMEPARVPTFTPDEPPVADLDAPEPTFDGANGAGPAVRMYGRRRRIHPKVWIATGLAAFAIAAAVLTLPELIFGGSVASSHRTTFFGGGSSSGSTKDKSQTTTSPTQTQTVTQTTTSTTPTTTSQTTTSTTPTTQSTTPTSTTPTTTTPSGTSTTPAPSGALTPTP